MRNSTKSIVIAAASVTVMWLLGYFPQAPSTTVPGKAAPSVEVVRTTVADLSYRYEINEVATDIALKGKVIQITGVVKSIEKNVWNSMYLTFATDNQFLPAMMNMNAKQETKVAALSPGRVVTIRCQTMKRWGGSPMGSDCVLM